MIKNKRVLLKLKQQDILIDYNNLLDLWKSEIFTTGTHFNLVKACSYLDDIKEYVKNSYYSYEFTFSDLKIYVKKNDCFLKVYVVNCVDNIIIFEVVKGV